MAEIFNVDLPPLFLYKPGTYDETKKDVEEYLDRFSSSVDEMFKRVFGRLDGNIETIVEGLWEVDGTETQLITADELDLQSKKIINLADPSAAQHAATKASQDAGDLWEVDGTEHQLKVADEIDMQSKNLINVLDPTTNQHASTKKYHDDDFNVTTGHRHDGADGRKVEADDLEDGGIANGKFLKIDSGVVVGADSSSLSSLAFHVSASDELTDTVSGLLLDPIGLTPDVSVGGAVARTFWGAVDDNVYHTIKSTKFKKLVGVDTVMGYARIWQSAGSGGSQAGCQLNIGGQTGSGLGTSEQQTPEWVSFTVDVSGLSDGTVYDVLVQIKSTQNASSYLSEIIAFNS